MELRGEIAAMRAGTGDPGALLGEFRRAAVLVPQVSGDRLLTRSFGGVRWILAFTDEAALARFTREPGSGGVPDAEWEYVSVVGARLLDAVIPALDGPTGVAVDIADEDGSMLFPPAPGIVPDEVAVGGTDEGEAL
ncbi:SseB family protein [Streptomyces oryzae]|uniref:SseB family protein n=1 Tax=Streptomyces oryzae TaxID=1434886 RepID=A0ABS3XBU4_9ACTN|nr:SseB family protein [Streptomyces oryzae]MBO8192833.1 SseB family protein [Streptomyces oryzae]